jgi:hypothetical protein
MFKRIWDYFSHTPEFDLVEGMYADEYTDAATRLRISRSYYNKYNPVETPQTHPHLYDPLAPPIGWRYDPYFEVWLKTKEK